MLTDNFDYYENLADRTLRKMGVNEPEYASVKQLAHAIESSEREIKEEMKEADKDISAIELFVFHDNGD